MALYPERDKLDAFPSRYVLTNLAARRAKQIKEGAPILVETTSTHPLTIALEEIAEGAVRPIILQGEVMPEVADTLDTIDLLSREAGGFDKGFTEIEKLFVGDIGPEFGAGMSDGGQFEEETISLDDLLQEEEGVGEGEDDLGTLDSLESLEDLEEPGDEE
jgi:DNA-directed RNA polymerase subunit omega